MTSTHQWDFFIRVEGKVALKYPGEIVIQSSLQIRFVLHLLSNCYLRAFSKLLVIYTEKIK